jgi:hypothetical protein
MFKFERDVTRSINHPFVIKQFDVVKSHGDIFVVMEHLPGGSLLELLNRGKMTLEAVLRVFSQLVAAVLYLHRTENFIHRDIKMENILFDENMNARLVDLGLGKSLVETGGHTTTVCGSLPYCAPELFQGKPYAKSVDVWSLGICLYGMVFGKLPFENDETSRLVDQIVSEDPPIPPQAPAMIADILTRTLKKAPEQRITIGELAQHPWIRKSTWQIYFEKSFQAVGPGHDYDGDAASMIRKWGMDPAKIWQEGSEEKFVRELLARRRQNEIAAHPEIMFNGEWKRVRSIPGLGVAPMLSWGPLETSSRPFRMVLDAMQQNRGFAVTQTTGGQGRRLMKPVRKVGTLYSSARSVLRQAADPCSGSQVTSDFFC